ncbi:MAG TPA: hypothetical protein DEQ88_00220 [Clostridiales bacterium]|nr:hypothetical protein [Clostridiales bacterium]
MSDTKDTIDKEAFGAKLCPDKEVIATYVGSIGARQLDASRLFNTGYISAFDMIVVVKDGENILIQKNKVIVPNYTTSTNETLYQSFLEGELGIGYKLGTAEITTVNNPVIAEQEGNTASTTSKLIISYEGENADIAAAALSAYFRNKEEDSISR